MHRMRQMSGSMRDGYPGLGTAEQSGVYPVRRMYPGMPGACTPEGKTGKYFQKKERKR